MFYQKNKQMKKSVKAAILSSFVVGAVLFAGCSSSDASNADTNTSGVTIQQSAADKPLSDARNTPAVRAAKTIGPTVVGITNKAVARDWFNNPVETEGVGSGVIFKADGYIVTNNHVVAGAKEIIVSLPDGRTFKGKTIGADELSDIAVVKIDAKDLTTATVGDSSTVEVGDLAVAIGNPLGQLGGTATSGIISALDRTLNVEGTTLTLLQTDAAINGGNSGGGLFNSKGELIGIVESKASAVGVEGLAFALPINNVSGIINDLIENGGNGQVAKSTPAVGIVISEVSEENAQYYGLESAGVYIAQVTGENAQKAGFQEEDRIVSFNGQEIKSSSEFISLVRKCKVGDTVTIVVSRKGQEIEIKTELEELQQQ